MGTRVSFFSSTAGKSGNGAQNGANRRGEGPCWTRGWSRAGRWSSSWCSRDCTRARAGARGDASTGPRLGPGRYVRRPGAEAFGTTPTGGTRVDCATRRVDACTSIRSVRNVLGPARSLALHGARRHGRNTKPEPQIALKRSGTLASTIRVA